ncbi:MAG: hypothetical protein KDE55_16980 [Novosphingobium sp.]|nr:hypothetical protein [Novosphingobium sp.]
MAEQESNKSRGKGKQPISRHPLFAATIALWFGALFGLGSLAIRPALLESIVLATHIDAIIPAAAPPLGMTSRILLALAMAGIGGLIGGTIARRIGRPKPEKRERTRGAATRFNNEEIATGGRRRSLTMAEDHSPAYYDDRAPVPGGAPQILNVNEFDLQDEPEADRSEAALQTASDRHPIEDDMLDLGAYGDAQGDRQPEEIDEEPADAAPSVEERRFAAPDFSAPEFTAPEIAKREFAVPAREMEAASRYQAIAASAPRLFDAPQAFDVDANHAEPDFEDDTVVALPTDHDQGLFSAEPREDAEPVPEPVGHEHVSVEPAATCSDTHNKIQGFSMPDENAAERIASSELGDLSQVELLERLALTMKRKREREAERAASATIAEPSVLTIPVEQEATEGEEEPERHSDTVEMADTPEPAPSIPPMFNLPAALRPVALDDDSGEEEELPAFVPPRHIGISATAQAPASQQLEPATETPAIASDESSAKAEEQKPLDPISEIFAAIEPEEASPDDSEDTRALEDGYSSLLSLSRPVGDRPQFVRVEEPESDGDAIEPVVVFPGQIASRQSPYSAPAPNPEIPSAADAQEQARARPFDAPGIAAAQGHAPATARQDPEETERALRAALASLQRMSGAA